MPHSDAVKAMADIANEQMRERGLPVQVVLATEKRAIEGCYQCGGPIGPDDSNIQMKQQDNDGNVVAQRAWHFGCHPRDMKAYLAESWPEVAWLADK